MKKQYQQVFASILCVAIILGTLISTDYFFDTNKNNKYKNSIETNSSHTSEILANEPIETVSLENQVEEEPHIQTGTIKKEVYTVCKKAVYPGSDSVISQSAENMGDGHYHIRGPVALIGEGSIWGSLYFGFNNPYFEKFGTPVSYTVKCSIRFNDWNDYSGYVRLYVEKDDGNLYEIWSRTGLATNGQYLTWDISWSSASSEYIRSDGTMNFIVSTYSVCPWLQQPSHRVDVTDLRVELSYNIDYFPPAGEVYSVFKYFVGDLNVFEVLAEGGSNTGDGYFHINALPVFNPLRGQNFFGLNNPDYDIYGAPYTYTVKCNIKYNNWNDNNGFIILYVQHDGGGWIPIWETSGLATNGQSLSWDVSWNSNSPEYYRDDGNMNFRILGSSSAGSIIERASFRIDVSNLRVKLNYKPVALISLPHTIYEGDTVILDASASISYSGYFLKYRWDIDGDGTWDTSFSEDPTFSYVWYDDYVGTVRLEIDDGVATDIETANIVVHNVAPNVYVGSDKEADEGVIVSFSGSFSDPGLNDTHTIEWDFGDGYSIVTGNLFPEHTYADNGIYTVILTVIDDDGGIGSDTLIITVNNVAPTVNINNIYQNQEFIIDDLTFMILNPINFSAIAYDPGADSLTFIWDWGDGTDLMITSYPNNPPNYPVEIQETVEHVYTEPGEYLVILTVEDDDGGIGTAEVTLNLLGPRELKENVISTLETLKTGNIWKDRKLNIIIKQIEFSLNDMLWIDATHLSSRYGALVFVKELVAVIMMEKCLAHLNLESEIIKLVKADELIARIALQEAQDTHINCSKFQKIVDKYLNQSNVHIEKAVEKFESGQYSCSIVNLKIAWIYAQLAMKWANKVCCPYHYYCRCCQKSN